MSRFTRKRVVVVGALALLGLVLAATVFFTLVVAPVGTRYLAKRMCSGAFVAGLAPDMVWRQELREGHFGYPGRFAWSIDRSARSATGTWFGMAEVKVRFRPGLGCTPDGAGKSALPSALSAKQLATATGSPFPWPSPRSTEPRLADAVAGAFEDGLGTRAVVIVHRGQLVAERYAAGVGRDTPLLGWSMNKSVMHAGFEGQFVTIIPSRDVVIVRLGVTPEAGKWNHAGLVKRVLAALTP